MMHRMYRFFRLVTLYLPTRPVTTTTKNRCLRNTVMLGIILVALIFTLQGRRTGTIIPASAAITRTTASSEQAYNTSYDHYQYILQRLRYLSWLHNMPPVVRDNNNTGLTMISPGILLSSQVLWTATGPVQVHMLNIDLTNPFVRLGVVQAHNRLISPTETLSSMARRTGAVAAINGDFFEEHGSGVPIGEEVINGQLLHGPNPHFYAVLGITSTGRLTIGPESFSGSVNDGAASYPLYSFNHYSEVYNGRLLLFTRALGQPVYVGRDPVAIIQPVAGSSTAYTVRSISSGIGWLPVLPAQQYALVGSGNAGYWLATSLRRGHHISIHMQITPDANLFQAIGGGPQVVQDGAFYYDPHPAALGERFILNPQTAISVSRDGTHALVAVFDGRGAGPWRSRGMTQAEVAYFMLAHGAYQAMLFDSGGSSEMVARLPGHNSLSIINWPSSGYERPIANGLFFYITGGTHKAAVIRHCQSLHPGSRCT
jgi:hypothetical protein